MVAVGLGSGGLMDVYLKPCRSKSTFTRLKLPQYCGHVTSHSRPGIHRSRALIVRKRLFKCFAAEAEKGRSPTSNLCSLPYVQQAGRRLSGVVDDQPVVPHRGKDRSDLAVQALHHKLAILWLCAVVRMKNLRYGYWFGRNWGQAIRSKTAWKEHLWSLGASSNPWRASKRWEDCFLTDVCDNTNDLSITQVTSLGLQSLGCTSKNSHWYMILAQHKGRDVDGPLQKNAASWLTQKNACLSRQLCLFSSICGSLVDGAPYWALTLQGIGRMWGWMVSIFFFSGTGIGFMP